MKAFFQDDITSFHVTLRDARMDRRGFQVDFVLPIENSTVQRQIKDLLMEFENYIGRAVICTAPTGLPDAELSDVKTVYSHSQALSQCKEYLGTHRDWKQIPMVNTAMAAKKVKEDGIKPGVIASAYAGERSSASSSGGQDLRQRGQSDCHRPISGFPLGCEEDQHFPSRCPIRAEAFMPSCLISFTTI